MKSKKKNSNRNHRSNIPYEIFGARARFKKFQKEKLKEVKGARV